MSYLCTETINQVHTSLVLDMYEAISVSDCVRIYTKNSTIDLHRTALLVLVIVRVCTQRMVPYTHKEHLF